MNKKRVHTPEGVRDVYLMYLTVKKEPYPQGRCLNSSIEKEIP